MGHFRRRPSHRRQPRPTATSIILGHSSAPILHQGRRAHLQTVTSRDHHKRYQPGQRLAVREYFPGPAECHVIVTDVTGPADGFTLGQVDYDIARELGHHRLDAFRVAWVTAHDHDWLAVHFDATEEEFLARFERRWAHKLAWLIEFRIDTAAPPRLLAARSDEIYVENDAQALRGEMPALSEAEWETHVGPRSHYRRREHEQARRLERETLGWPDRLAAAKAAAKAKGYDIRDEVRRFDRLIQNGKTAKAMTQLARIEQRVFPLAA